MLDSIETLDDQTIPDQALDNEETRRLVMQIIDGLPAAQWMTVVFFYYDEMSVKDIAGIMEGSEGTVKSRLNYARKAIKLEVEKLEKKGTKLYSISILPFLAYFLRMGAEMQTLSPAAAAAITQGTMSAAGAGAAAAGASAAGGAAAEAAAGGATTATGTTTAGASTAGAAVGTKVGGTISVKVIAGVLAGVLAVGGVSAYIAARSRPVSHTWLDATCTEPEACSVCGATQGEALGHNMTEANYQMSATCTVCGVTEGDVLTPSFVEHGVELSAYDGTYDCIFPTYSERELDTVGHVTLADYQVFTSDETHPAKKGCEYRTATLDVLYDDENAWTYGNGMRYTYQTLDYYSKNVNTQGGSSVKVTDSFIMNFMGEDHEVTFEMWSEFGEWQSNGSIHGTIHFEALAPVGYDGVVVTVFDGGIVPPPDISPDDLRRKQIYEKRYCPCSRHWCCV